MTYSRNWLDIANRALVKAGNQQIDSFSGGTDNIKTINTLLPEAIETVSAMYPWRCLRNRVSLSPSDKHPEFGYKYAYPLPENFASIVSIDTSGPWVREAGNILTDSEYCDLVYIKLPSEPTDVIPSLRELIVIRLAYLIAQTTTSNTTLQATFSNEFDAALLLAERADSQGEPDITEYEGYTKDR